MNERTKENTKTESTSTSKINSSAPDAAPEGRTKHDAGDDKALGIKASERGGKCVAGYYEALGREIGALVSQKQVAYGDSFGKSGEVLRILYPNGVSPEQIDEALCVVRIIDKLFRIATNRDALGESPYLDIAGYALLGAARAERKQ